MTSLMKTTLALAISSLSISAMANEQLAFPLDHYESRTATVNGETIEYRAYENLSYVTRPVAPEYQTLNVYVPEAYFNGGSVDGYKMQTAPIFLPNSVGGYMPGKAMVAGIDERRGEPNSALVALSRGLVVAAPGARGRTNQDEEGNYIGKAPAAIVDLKAAVRYLHFNDALMPGDASRIISNGTSAGGALSSLLGASGDSADYEPYLKALGAADASDAIFAVSAYCPITDLDHADMAYEWQFNGYSDYEKMSITMLDYQVQRKLVKGTLTPAEEALSDLLKPLYPDYINSLKLTDQQGMRLTLDEQGEGTFKDHILALLIESAQKAVDAGVDMTPFTFVTFTNGKVFSVDWDGYREYAGRQKLPPAFDGVDLSTGENNLFGSKFADNQFFTDFAQQHATTAGSRVSDNTVKLMNPLYYIGEMGVNTAPNWRIRVGGKDRDTSLAVSAVLATRLQNEGYQVDYHLPWDVGHSGDYDLDELFDWVKGLR